VKYFAYKSYEEYLSLQKKISQKTLRRTCGYDLRRDYIYMMMQKYKVKGKTILSVGTRNEVELDFFEKKGYKAEGIDLFKTNKIIECDMSRIYKHPILKNKKYDIVFSSDSLEHCLDLKGFIKELNKICKRYFVCMCKVASEPDCWDCSIHPFMMYLSDFNICNKELLKTFKNFKVVVNEIQKHNTRLFFILKKKKK